MDDDLSTRQQAALLTLMAEARQLTNRELGDIAGAELARQDREHLLALGYITCRTDRAPYLHELTADGWSWCRDFLRTGRRTPRSGPSATVAVLRNLRRHLDDTSLSLQEVFRPSWEPLVRAAYAACTKRAQQPGSLVSLATLRPLLSDIPRDDLDRTLDYMITWPDVQLVGEENQKSLSDDERDAAVRVGGEPKYYLSIEPSIGPA